MSKKYYILWFLIGVILGFLMVLAACQDTVYAYDYTPEEIVMIGKIVEHEAPHESELGQRLVIDTIMNRVEHGSFPDTVKGVLSQPGQYCNPKKYPPDYIYTLIAQEAVTRTNDQVLWYRTKRYHSYGIPIIQEGSHYFSGGI